MKKYQQMGDTKDIQVQYDRAEHEFLGRSNAMDIQERKLGLRCTVLPEGKVFSFDLNPPAYVKTKTVVCNAWVSSFLSAEWKN